MKAPLPSTLASYCALDPVSEFKSSLKCDAHLFAVYKDKKQWDMWQHSTVAQSRAQDVAKILDASYAPVSSEDAALFAKKQELMYAVFKCTLQTDQGKAFVHLHEADLMLRRFTLLSNPTCSRPNRPCWTHPSFSAISHWPKWAMVLGKSMPIPSSSTGKTSFVCMRSRLPLSS